MKAGSLRPVAVAMLYAAAMTEAGLAGDVTISVDPNHKHQTILGWGATVGAGKGQHFPEYLRQQLLDAAVNDLGLTRARFEIPRREWEDVHNDDADANHVNWSAFKTADTDRRMQEWILPFKKRIEANGEHFCMYVSPSFFAGGSSGSVPQWMLDDPAEHAEWASAFLEYIKKKHDLTADYYSICNEAGNNNAFSPQVVAKAIKALGPRIKSMGLPTRIQFPECVNAGASWQYIQKTQDDAEMWSYVGLVTYHLYGSLAERPLIRDFAYKRGLPTGQTEFMGTTINHLYDDLVQGGVSYWEHYGLAGPWTGNGTYYHTHLSGTYFWPYREYWNFRQVMHYVRPGAVRIEVTSDEEAVRVLAFLRERKVTVVLLNLPPNAKSPPPAQDRSAVIRGLPAGKYGLCRSAPGKPYQELGIQTVAAVGTLKVAMGKNAVLTVYPYAGTNQPPVIMEWKASPVYLIAPASAISLSVTATDPETEPLFHQWTVLAKPDQANVAMDSPSAMRTQAKGLSVPGDYLFEVAVSDATHKVNKQVKVTVFADNQPPVILDLHNRLPVTVIQPASGTTICGAALYLEGDPVTYQWSVIRQPQGASVVLDKPTEPRCPVTNMTVAGEYVFKVEVKEPKHTVSKDLTVTVYPKLPKNGVRENGSGPGR